ncbi:SPOR domain-containing protein [Allostella humosa]|uniref:SPOR domain-containing protein n=1 Tax=Stella humosa TaxID=94 RepID=UPI0011518A60|nr:SPOR domain-containing protein [Stella humosa]
MPADLPPAAPVPAPGRLPGPSSSQPSYQPPAYAPPPAPYQPPAYPSQAYQQQPAYARQSYQPPPPAGRYPDAGYQPPAYEQRNYPRPSYQQPDYQPPAYQQPSYQQPSYQAPSYQPPSYQAPAYAPRTSAPAPAYAPQPGYQPAPSNYPPSGTTQRPPPAQTPPAWMRLPPLPPERQSLAADRYVPPPQNLAMASPPPGRGQGGYANLQTEIVEPGRAARGPRNYRVWLGTVSTEAQARWEWERLLERHPRALTSAAADAALSPAERGWRIYAGRFETMAAASAFCAELRLDDRLAGCMPYREPN